MRNAEGARFCRKCGESLASNDSLPVADPTGTAAPSPSGVPNALPSSPPRVDEQRLFRELCWLCGSMIAISVLYAITVQIAGFHPLGELLAVSAVGVVALVGVGLNRSLVRSALRLPNLRGMLDTLLVALLTAPTLLAGFWVLEQLGFRIDSGNPSAYTHDNWPIWSGFVCTAVVTPISEELLFRGLIQPKLEQIVSSREALIVQAAVFAALHLSPVILVTHFAMGLAFGFVRRRTGSLFPGMLLHAGWNAWVLWSSLG